MYYSPATFDVCPRGLVTTYEYCNRICNAEPAWWSVSTWWELFSHVGKLLPHVENIDFSIPSLFRLLSARSLEHRRHLGMNNRSYVLHSCFTVVSFAFRVELMRLMSTVRMNPMNQSDVVQAHKRRTPDLRRSAVLMMKPAWTASGPRYSNATFRAQHSSLKEEPGTRSIPDWGEVCDHFSPWLRNY